MSGLWSDNLDPRQKVAAVAKVRLLEHVVFEGEQHRGGADEGTVAEINQLRHALGWLEVDTDGQWRWPSRPTS